MRPRRLSRMWRVAGRMTVKWPFRCTATTASHSSSVMLKIMRSRRMPAQQTTMWRSPKRARAASTIDWPPAIVATLSAFAIASPPRASISLTTACAAALDGSRPSTVTPKSLTTTLAPARASPRATPRPIPLPAPVTTATFPSSSPMRLSSGLRAAEARRWWALEDDPPSSRVDEAQPRGVQTDTPQGVAAAPVRAVADDRVPARRELSPDLAPPSRHERELEQRRPPRALQHAVTGDRLLAVASIARGPDAQRPILHERRGQRPLRLTDDALHAGHVHPLRRARVELRLERPLHLERLGEDEEAGRLAIEAVDDEDPRASPRSHPVPEQAIDGPLALGLGRDRQEPRRFVDNDEVLVLVNESERRRHGGRCRRVQVDTVRRAHRSVAAGDDDAVDANARAVEPLFEPAARRLRVEGAQPLSEPQVLSHGTD